MLSLEKQQKVMSKKFDKIKQKIYLLNAFFGR